jgi:hypothetical protein
MGVLEAVLAIIGLIAVVAGTVRWQVTHKPEPPAEEVDIAAPYREGLHAAIRVQRAAQDLEAQMFTEAKAGSTAVGLMFRQSE